MKKRRKYVTLAVIVCGLLLIGYTNELDALLYVALGLLIVGLLVHPFAVALDWFWFKLGRAIGFVVSPVVLVLFFYVILTPLALAKKLFSSEDAMGSKGNPETMWKQRVHLFESKDLENPW